MEDDDTEPDEGEIVGALEEGNVVGALEETDAVEAPEEERDQAASRSIWDEICYFFKNKYT